MSASFYEESVCVSELLNSIYIYFRRVIGYDMEVGSNESTADQNKMMSFM